MKPLLLLFAVATVSYGALPRAAISANVKEYKTSMDTILKAIGTPACVRTCIDPLIDTIGKIWDMKNIKSHAKSICDAYDKAEACLEKDAYCDLQKGFQKAASGLRHRCQTQIKLYEAHEKCVDPQLDRVTQKCDAKCNGRQSVVNYSKKTDIQNISKYGGNALIAAGHVSELCRALACTIPCFTEELNSVCKNSGWLALDSMMQPLEHIASGVDTVGPVLKKYVLEKMDEGGCKFVVDAASQKKIRKGDWAPLKKKN